MVAAVKRTLFSFIFLFSLLSLKAQQNQYAIKQIEGLEKELDFYHAINSYEWMYFSCDSCLSPGNRSQVILHLRQDLLLTGDLRKEENTGEELFDASLENALKKFQRRHGIKEEGILGSETIKALNIPIVSRISTIKDNLEKWRKFSQLQRDTFLLVNIPDFSLKIIDKGEVVQTMNVVVGRLRHPTPLFHAELKYLVVHPSWSVPYSISVNEILPMLQTDPFYLKRNHMDTYTFSKGSKIKVTADTINWSLLDKNNFRYFFEQVPGTWNALGKIKFIFPNPYNVYLHDTPEKHLFSHNKRTYSHGCVRVENPEELAGWLLQKNQQEIEEMISTSKNNTVMHLSKSIPVCMEYFTSWVDEEGKVQFRENIYNYNVP